MVPVGGGQRLTAVATGAATAIALPLLAARHVPAGITGPQAVAVIAGGGIATAVFAALGVGGLAAATTRTAGFPTSDHLLGPAAAVLVLAGYAAAALLAGAALLRQRDITP